MAEARKSSQRGRKQVGPLRGGEREGEKREPGIERARAFAIARTRTHVGSGGGGGGKCL